MEMGKWPEEIRVFISTVADIKLLHRASLIRANEATHPVAKEYYNNAAQSAAHTLDSLSETLDEACRNLRIPYEDVAMVFEILMKDENFSSSHLPDFRPD